MSNRFHIGNLSPETKASAITEALQRHGKTPVRIQVVMSRDPGRSRGSGQGVAERRLAGLVERGESRHEPGVGDVVCVIGDEVDDARCFIRRDSVVALRRNVPHHLNDFIVRGIQLKNVTAAQHGLKGIILLGNDVGCEHTLAGELET